MNAKQRRIAYRKQPKAGTVVSWTNSKGKTLSGVVVGPSMIWDINHPNAWKTRKTPDTARVCVEFPDNHVFSVHVLVRKLIK